MVYTLRLYTFFTPRGLVLPFTLRFIEVYRLPSLIDSQVLQPDHGMLRRTCRAVGAPLPLNALQAASASVVHGSQLKPTGRTTVSPSVAPQAQRPPQPPPR